MTSRSLCFGRSHFIHGNESGTCSSVEFQFHSLDLNDDSGAESAVDGHHKNETADPSWTGNESLLQLLSSNNRSKSADCIGLDYLHRHCDQERGSSDPSIKSMDDRLISSSKVIVSNCTGSPNRTFKIIFIGDVSIHSLVHLITSPLFSSPASGNRLS